MIINGKNISIEELINEIDINPKDFLKKRKNGLILRDSHIEILKRNGINYENYSNLKSIIFEIEQMIENGESDEELEALSEELSEIYYYNYTNK